MVNTVSSQELVHQSFTTKDGLPSNEVYHVYQDVNGLMWFATDRGIASYDGYEFKTYTTEEGLTSNTIFKFYPQEDGNIWCTTSNNQYFYFHPKDYIFHKYKFNHLTTELGLGETPADLAIDTNNTIYVSFFDCSGFLAITQTGQIIKTPRAHRSPEDYNKIDYNNIQGTIRSICQKNIGSYKFIYSDSTNEENATPNMFSNKKLETSRFDKIEIQDRTVYLGYLRTYITNGNKLLTTIEKNNYFLLLDKWDKDHFWVSSWGEGLFIYDYNGKQKQHLFKESSISHILKDHEGGSWFSTLENGVFYIPNFHLDNYQFEKNQAVKKLSHNHEELNLILYNNNLYSRKFKSFTKRRNLELLNIQHYDSLGTVQVHYNEFPYPNVVSFTDLNQITRKKKVPPVKKLSDNKEEKPILIDNRNFKILNDLEWINYPTMSKLKDACFFNNGVLIALHQGLHFYDTTQLTHSSFNSMLDRVYIQDIDNLTPNSFVAATRGHGIVIYKDNKLEFIKQSNGLASNHCNEVYLQNDSTVWVCTSKGLNKVLLHNDGKKTIQSFSTICGLMDNDILDFDILKDTAWIASKSGLTSVPIKHFKSDSIQRETIFDLIKLSVNGIDTSSLVQLSHDENRLQFNFRTISFTSAPVTYRYRLKGLETQWNITSEREALYQSVPPGEYTFEVQTAINSIWQEKVIQIPVSITPPFYRTWWFRFFIVFLIGGIIYLFFRYRLLSYNWDLSREILRKVLKRLNKENTSFIVESNGKQVKIESSSVLYVEAQRNYIEIHTIEGRHLVREKISSFTELVPDPIEYIRISRSCVVRIDQVTAKSKQSISIKDTELKVGKTYISVLNQIHL